MIFIPVLITLITIIPAILEIPAPAIIIPVISKPVIVILVFPAIPLRISMIRSFIGILLGISVLIISPERRGLIRFIVGTIVILVTTISLRKSGCQKAN